jgi:WD40 repeat protein
MTGLIGTNTAIGDNPSSLVTAAAMVAYERRMCAQIIKSTESARTNDKNQLLNVVNNNLDDSSDSFRTTMSLIPSGDAQFARKLKRLREIQQRPLSLHPSSNIKNNGVVEVEEEDIATPTIPVEVAILSRTNMDDEKQQHQHQQIPVIPSIILMENIASYVNERLVWNVMATLNRECYAISKNLIHLLYRPWPRIRWRAGLTTPKKQNQQKEQPQQPQRRRVARGVQVSTRPCTVAFGEDFLCCGTNQGDILVWKVHENGSKRLLQGHCGRVNSVQCYHDWLVSAGDDTAIRIWNVRTMSCESIIVTGHGSSITSVAILPFDDAQRKYGSNNDDKISSSSCMLVATASMDCDVRLFAVYYEGTKVIFTRHLTTFTGPELIQGPIYSIVMYKKDKRHYLISGGLIGRLRLWDIDSSIAGIIGSGGSYCAEHNTNPPEKTNNATTTTIGTTVTTTAYRNKCIFKYDGAVKSIVISRDKNRIAAAFGRTVCYGTISDDPFYLDQNYNTMMTNELIVENETNYEETIDNGNNDWRVLKGHSGDIRSIDFSLDGKSIASACTDGSIRLWELGDGTWKRKWKAHNGFMVCSLAISPDGQCLLSAGSDGTIAIETTLT